MIAKVRAAAHLAASRASRLALSADRYRSRRIVRTVSHEKPPITPIRTAIKPPSHHRILNASYIPQMTPTGVLVSKIGLAIRMARAE